MTEGGTLTPHAGATGFTGGPHPRAGWRRLLQRLESPPPAARLLLFLVPAVLLFLRNPEHLLLPQFYAEDGAGFYKEAWEAGPLAKLLAPTEGYLNLYPRVAAAFAQFFPLEWGPLVVVLFGLLPKMVVVAYLFSDRAARLIPRFPLRLAAGLLYVLLPNSEEIHGNITNAQWNLTPVACLILLGSPPAGWLGKAADALLLALFSLTGPTSVLFLPVTALYLRAPAGRSAWGRTVAGILLAGASVQASFLLAHPPAHRFSPGRILEIGGLDLVRILSNHLFFDVFVGVHRARAWQASLGLASHFAGLLALSLLAIAAVRRREAPLVLLLYCAVVTVALSLLLPSNDLRGWLDPGFGLRYYFSATLFIVFAAARLAFSGGWSRAAGAAGLASILAVAIPGDFLCGLQEDTHFRDQVAVFNALPPGTTFDLPISPGGWYMSLRKKPGSPVTPNPLDRLPILEQDPYLFLQEPKIAARGAIGSGGETLVQVGGMAYAGGARAGGVIVVAGGRMYPASYGFRLRSPPKALMTNDGDFSRLVPLADVERGGRRLLFLVLTADRKSYFRPYEVQVPPLH